MEHFPPLGWVDKFLIDGIRALFGKKKSRGVFFIDRWALYLYY